MFDNFNKVEKLNILVIGDIILDKYIHGTISRMSPEAPVPVVLTDNESYVLGGAANVATNLISLGANAFLIGTTGKDRNGAIILELVKDLLGNNSGIIQSNKKTTTKTRVVSRGKQLLRIDDEDITNLNQSESAILLESIENELRSKSFNGIVLQDYDKGLFSKEVIDAILKLSNDFGTPVFVDPKHKNFWNFKGVKLFKPNLSELKVANKAHDEDSLELLLEKTFAKLNCEILMCTLADEGIIFVQDGKIQKIPTQKIDVMDVSGAGDSAIAMMILGFLLGYDTKSVAVLSNFCGAASCLKSGVSAVTLDEVKTIHKSVYKDIVK